MSKTKGLILETFGWYGTFAIILAYILLSFKFINSDSLVYQILNLTGSLGIIFSSYFKKNYQPVVLNIIWFIVAVIAITTIFWS